MGGKLPPVVARSREDMRCDGPGPDAFCDPEPAQPGPSPGVPATERGAGKRGRRPVDYCFFSIFAQESLSVTVRLNTGCSGVPSGSAQK